MDIRTLFDLIIVILIFSLLRPMVQFILKKFPNLSNITFGIAAVLSFALLLTKPEGMVRNSFGLLLVVYFIYAWWVDRRIDLNRNKENE